MRSRNRKDSSAGRIAILPLTVSLQALLLANPALAQNQDSEISLLRAQIEALSSRLSELESRESAAQAQTAAAQQNAAPKAASWVDNIRISGDLRTRYEGIEDDGQPHKRDRARIRARLGITDRVNDDWNLGLGFASGSDDPISTNQTLGGDGSTKDLRLDYAYFEYRGISNTMVTGGKYRNVFFKPGGQNLIFDGDYRPEGVAMKYTNGNLFFNAADMLLESDNNSGKQDTAFMWGAQLGYKAPIQGGSLSFGASYYEAEVQGSNPFYHSLSYNNTLDASGRYMNDFKEVELFADASFDLGDKSLNLYADYVNNTAASRFDTGWATGVRLEKDNWELGYGYQDLEADAVFGAMTDSDFSGGGTDGKGHVIDFSYELENNANIGFDLFINQYGNAVFGREIDYTRLHLFVSQSF